MLLCNSYIVIFYRIAIKKCAIIVIGNIQNILYRTTLIKFFFWKNLPYHHRFHWKQYSSIIMIWLHTARQCTKSISKICTAFQFMPWNFCIFAITTYVQYAINWTCSSHSTSNSTSSRESAHFSNGTSTFEVKFKKDSSRTTVSVILKRCPHFSGA